LKISPLFSFSGVALASTLHLSPEQMAECWEAFSMNKKVNELTDHTFQAYRTQLLKECDSTMTADVGAVQLRTVKREATNMVTPPPAKKQQTPTSTSSVDSVARDNISSPRRPTIALPKYNERTKVGEPVASYNPNNLPAISAPATSNKAGRCLISTDAFNNVKEPYRHMFTTLEERAKALEKHLQTMGKEIIDKYGISDGENGIAPLEQGNVSRQEPICCIGRICNEVSDC
jgi:hypothetical protein